MERVRLPIIAVADLLRMALRLSTSVVLHPSAQPLCPARAMGQAEMAIVMSAAAGKVDDAMVPLMLPPRGRQ